MSTTTELTNLKERIRALVDAYEYYVEQSPDDGPWDRGYRVGVQGALTDLRSLLEEA